MRIYEYLALGKKGDRLFFGLCTMGMVVNKVTLKFERAIIFRMIKGSIACHYPLNFLNPAKNRERSFSLKRARFTAGNFKKPPTKKRMNS